MADPGDPQRGKRLAGQILLILGCALAALALVGMFAQGLAFMSRTELTGGLLGILLVCGIPAIIGAILMQRAGPAPTVVAAPGAKRPMTALRIIFAVFAALLMLFSGGCALLFIGSSVMSPQNGFAEVPIVALLAGPPFLAGMVIWLLAVKAGRT
jgi:hypothetical protein